MYSKELFYISIILEMINDIIDSNSIENKNKAYKYMNYLQDSGCKLRKVQGIITLVDYNQAMTSKL
jgi:hypothetical protein